MNKRGATAYSVRDYYGNVVSSGSISIPDYPYALNFDNGTNGSQILTTDNFGSETVPNAVLDQYTAYSNSVKYTGTLSMFCGVGIRWTMENKTDHYGRFYYYRDAETSNGTHLFLCGDSSGTARLIIRSTHQFRIADDAGHGITSTNTFALSQWVRIEYRIIHSTTVGQVEFKLFADPTSSTPTEVLTSPASWNTGATAEKVEFGQVDGTRDTVCWIDGIVANATSYVGTTDPSPVVSGNTLVVTPTAPAGGWRPGWYRLYLTGPQTDSLFGNSYGATNFVVIRSDSHFPTMPGPLVNGSAGQGESPDFITKGVMGLGTSRILISDATNLNSGDTLSSAVTAAGLTSTYWSNTGTPDTERPTRSPWAAFPNGGYTAGQQTGVTTVVSTLYPLGVTRFEGPENEPEAGNHTLSATTASHMQSFQSAVHAGNANAKAIGPSALHINDMTMWRAFGDAGGFNYCDEISFHAYNFATAGDLNLGRNTLNAFVAMLQEYGAHTKPRWQTESTHAFNSVYNVYHPRRARVYLLQTLLMEQYDIPRERNNWWYDASHGFWNYPAWIINGDGSLNPQAVLGRVLAEETWGKPYAAAVDFGTPGNNIYIGNRYTNAAGASTIAFMSASHLDNGSVTFSISGTGNPITVVDGFGNATSVAQTAGKITVTMTDIPAYIRLPAGASVTVSSINGWANLSQSSFSHQATTKTFNGTTKTLIADNAFTTNYGSVVGTTYTGDGATPTSAILLFNTNVPFGRMIWWCGAAAWQYGSTLVDFDIDITTNGGSSWTTIKTVTRATPTSFLFATNSTNTGCQRETFWDEQWIFDIPLDAQVTCNGVRIYVRQTSYGGEPDAAALAVGGQGWGAGNVSVQEIGLYSESGAPVLSFGRGPSLLSGVKATTSDPADGYRDVERGYLN